jgi:hypothetical protein
MRRHSIGSGTRSRMTLSSTQSFAVAVQKSNMRQSISHGFEFQKRRQFFIRSCNETLSIVAMCVNNPDCSSVEIEDH